MENEHSTRHAVITDASGKEILPGPGVAATDEMETSALKIDLEAILDQKLKRRLPRWLIHRLQRIIRERELNAVLRHAFPAAGWLFATRVLEYLGISVEARGLDNIPSEGRFVFASNHPLGGLDGIALIALLGRIYGDGGIQFPVNDLLMNVRPLKGVFVPINKYKGQGRGGTLAISGAYASDAQILIFPAGLVSRLQEEGIRDLKWQKSFVAKAKETGRSIIPVYFGGVNTMRFYRWARWRKKLGLKFNFEQVLLPGELCRATGKRFTVTFGKPIDPAVLDKVTPSLRGEIVKDRVYALAPE